LRGPFNGDEAIFSYHSRETSNFHTIYKRSRFMKRFLLIGLIIAVVLILVGGAGVVYARVNNLGNNATVKVITPQNGNQNPQPFNYGPGGRMHEYGFGGMMGGRGPNLGRGTGLLHDYVVSAFAKPVGLTVDQVNTRLSNGETLTQIATAEGFTGDKLTQLVQQVWQSAVNQAVTDGVITQNQADRILQRLNNYPGGGFGPGFGFGGGNCPMWDGDENSPTY
jgi:hypothetical protein